VLCVIACFPGDREASTFLVFVIAVAAFPTAIREPRPFKVSE